KNCFIAAIIFCSFQSYAQKRGNVWCFGDSAGINFNNASNPIPIATGLRTRGSCASISDTSGQLLFYANDRTNTPGDYTTLVYNRLHQIMPNGDSIVGEGWYNEMVIIPFPTNDSLYYLFVISTALGPQGLYYSIINMNADSGRGDVISKNIQLQTFSLVDCLTAIKHGNGRDWWLFFRRYDGTNATTNDKYMSYLISPAGITNYHVQHVGSMMNTGLGQLKFNKQGNRLAFNSYKGTLELYDFDRCTGILSNPVTIYSENTSPPWPSRCSSEFSSSDSLLYVCNNPSTSTLFQYDLTAANIAASAVTLWTTSYPLYCGGALKRAPDDKIYFSCVYYNGMQFPYPYADTMYNVYNMNLSVINQPDSLGTASDFQPYSFHLGGKRTYWGLPNNPDYDMPADSGSICDTLSSVGISEIETANHAEMFVSYIREWQKLFINAQHLKGKNCLLQIIDMNGRFVFSSEKKTAPPYFTMDVNCVAFAKGMYIVSLQTEKEKLVKKFVKE
ncbi:MAG: T9SS type A sorting domain-containing protein, partial [Bacteroidota bacterium]